MLKSRQHNKLDLLRTSLAYSSVKVISLISLMLVNLSLPEFVSNDLYAEYGLVSAYFSFMVLLNWGMPTILERQLSENKNFEEASLRSLYATFCVLSISLVMVYGNVLGGISIERMGMIGVAAFLNLIGLFNMVVLRRKSELGRICFYLLALPLILLAALTKLDPSTAFLLAYAVSSLLLWFANKPKKIIFKSTTRKLIADGFAVFLYNVLVYSCMILPRIIGGNASADDYAKLTFNWFLANAVLLGIQSISFMIQPRLYDLLREDSGVAEKYSVLYRGVCLTGFAFLLSFISLTRGWLIELPLFDKEMFGLLGLIVIQIAMQQGHSQLKVIHASMLRFAAPLLLLPIFLGFSVLYGFDLVVFLIGINVILFLANVLRGIIGIAELFVFGIVLYSWICGLFALLVYLIARRKSLADVLARF